MYLRSRQQKISRQEPTPTDKPFLLLCPVPRETLTRPLKLIRTPSPQSSTAERILQKFRTRRGTRPLLTAASWGRGPRPDRGSTGGQAVQCLGRRRYRCTASQGPPGLFDSAPANLLVTWRGAHRWNNAQLAARRTKEKYSQKRGLGFDGKHTGLLSSPHTTTSDRVSAHVPGSSQAALDTGGRVGRVQHLGMSGQRAAKTLFWFF
ncbi:hypothetical protein CCHR01_19309 [Colletotrichum chrysophilum]|uniref:Uncharacterized protein n=1 Tax=Colletotrichum chrysophilum TaxID=1836956 RepID=A0AAD9E7X4_9PEZI|nr:hypothetical protein CCHR01_19309 [Colletotrichum chrysophilum]